MKARLPSTVAVGGRAEVLVMKRLCTAPGPAGRVRRSGRHAAGVGLTYVTWTLR